MKGKNANKKGARKAAIVAEVKTKPVSDSPGTQKGWLAAQSYYLASIFDPLMNDGAKIPDVITAPSATAQCIQRVQVSVNAQGVAGIAVALGRTNGTDYYTTASGATSALPAWNSAVSKSYSGAVTANAQLKRLVSGAIYYEYQGSPLNRKGRAILNYDPQGTSYVNPTTANVTGDLMVRPFAADLNVADRANGLVRHVPQDNNSLVYTTPTASSYYSFLTAFIDGANPLDIVEFTIVENYEFIPLNSQYSLITPSPSISDPIEMSLASNAVTQIPEFPVLQPPRDPLTMTMGQDQIGLTASKSKPALRVHSPQESSHTGRSPTFFERMIGGVRKVLPGVKKALAFGVDLATILGPLLA